MGTTSARLTTEPPDDGERPGSGSTSLLESVDDGLPGDADPLDAASADEGSDDLALPRRRVVVAWSGDPTVAPVRRRTRRRHHGWWQAALVLVALVIGGSVVTSVRIERDLERRALDALRSGGAVGVDVTFSGQDGEVRCGVPQEDPVALAEVVRAVRGVRTVRVADECAGPVGAPASAAPAAGPSAEASGPDDASGSDEPAELAVNAAPVVEPATGAAPDATDPPAATAGGGTLPPVVTLSVTAVVEGGRMVLGGTVPHASDRDALVAAATGVLGADAVVDQLLVLPDASIGIDGVEDRLAATTRLIGVAATHLMTGSVTLDRSTLAISGVYATAADLTAVRAEADASGAGMQVSQHAEAASQAELVADLLTQIVAADPIVFRPGASELDESADAVLDRIAAVANRYEGVSILVVGHTDSAGDATWNQVLSEQRALVVAAALMERGVRVPLDADGKGASEPVAVGGAEDPVASRRVEFVVTDA